MIDKNKETRQPPYSVVQEAVASVRRLRSRDLLAGAPEVLIDHEGREYRLRVTRNGKLILTA